MSLEKQKLRLEIKNKLLTISSHTKKLKNESLSDNLLKLIASLKSPSDEDSFFFQKTLIGGFAPVIEEEPEWFLGFDRFRQAYPRVLDKNLEFRECKIEQLVPLVEFARKINGPDLQTIQVQPNILIVPGRAFDMSGNRLGRGGGFYDRYLKNFNHLAIGVCFSEQVVELIQADSWDQKVDALVTDEQIVCLEGWHILERQWTQQH